MILDVSIVNVALPSIGRELHYSATGLQWVVNAYVLTFAGFLLLGGRAGDLFGRRRTFLFGLFLFSAASLVGGFAQNAAWLTTARAFQGLGGAVLSPATLTILATTFTGAKRAKALGLWGAMGGAGGAVGVILGGVLTSSLSWRWVLFVNVPIGVAAMAVTVLYLAEPNNAGIGPGAIGSGPVGRQSLDVAGALTVTGGLAVLVYGIVGTDITPWGSTRTLTTLAIGAALLGLFVFLEMRVARAPLMPMRLFRSRAVTGANVVMFLVGTAFFATWYFLSLYLQDVLRYDALRTGLAFLPMTITIIAGAQLSGYLLRTVGLRVPLVIGTSLGVVGFLWLSRIGADSSYLVDIVGPGCLVSAGVAILFAPLAAGATAGVRPAEAGLASGMVNTSRQFGGSIGLAVLATIATAHTRSILTGGSTSSGLVGISRGVRAAALSAGFSRVFLIASGVLFVAFLAGFLLPSIEPPSHTEAVSEPAARIEQRDSPALTPAPGTV